MRTICLEEHFVSPAFLAGPGNVFIEQVRSRGPNGARIFDQLQEIGARRIGEMDAAGIDVQVLSLNSPGVEQADPAQQLLVAEDANDMLAGVIKQHPQRFAAFAALPTATPDRAASELELRVKTQNFRGALINGHTRGRYLDDQFFCPILERAEALNVPIYLHPTAPPKPVIETSYAGFSPLVSGMLATAAWGWHIETAIHLLRMVVGGVFDRFPKLQIIVGHMGEGIPFMLPRLSKNFPLEMTKLKRPVGDYFRQNVHYTFGGFNFATTFQNLLQEIGVERIMFSADHPFGSMKEARDFLHTIPVSEQDRVRIAHGNAEALLRL